MKHPALSEKDYATDGFQWIDCHQENRCIYAFERASDRERIIAVFNFSDEVQEYELMVKKAEGMTLLMSSDNEIYGGNTWYRDMEYYELKSEKVNLKLSPFSGKYFKVI